MQTTQAIKDAQEAAQTPDIQNGDFHGIRKASLILRSLNHKLRQQILLIINNEGKITVTNLYVRLRLEQSVASQHLAILRKAGIVSTQREGKHIYYKINDTKVESIARLVKDLIG